MSDQGKTGKSDTTYNLTSVYYHALKGAQVYDQYIQDAEKSGQKEIADFFREVQQQDKKRAEQAQTLMSRQFK